MSQLTLQDTHGGDHNPSVGGVAPLEGATSPSRRGCSLSLSLLREQPLLEKAGVDKQHINKTAKCNCHCSEDEAATQQLAL